MEGTTFDTVKSNHQTADSYLEKTESCVVLCVVSCFIRCRIVSLGSMETGGRFEGDWRNWTVVMVVGIQIDDVVVMQRSE